MIPVSHQIKDSLIDRALLEGDRSLVWHRMLHDVNGDGILEDIVVVVGQGSRKIVFCDHAASVLSEGEL